VIWRPFNRLHVAVAQARGRGGSPNGPTLVVQLGKIGDFVLTTPLIRALAGRRLVLVVNETARNLAEACPYAEEVLTVRTGIGNRHLWANLRQVHSAGRHLRRLGPSVAIVPRWSADLQFEAPLARLSGGIERIGFAPTSDPYRARRNVHYDGLFTATVPGRTGLHEAVQMLAVLEPLGLPTAGEHLEVWLTDEDRAAAARALAGATDSVAIAPGAGTPHRRWPVDRFAAVAARLRSDGLRPIVVGDRGDAAAAAAIVDAVPGSVDLTGALTLRQTAAALARCRLLVANDSGPAHLAAAVGTPVVQVSTHPIGAAVGHDNAPERFRPLGVPAEVIRPIGLAGCEDGCGAAEPHCILRVEAAPVIDAALRLLVQGGAVAPSGAGRS
jgi:heptosyltransferase-2